MYAPLDLLYSSKLKAKKKTKKKAINKPSGPLRQERGAWMCVGVCVPGKSFLLHSCLVENIGLAYYAVQIRGFDHMVNHSCIEQRRFLIKTSGLKRNEVWVLGANHINMWVSFTFGLDFGDDLWRAFKVIGGNIVQLNARELSEQDRQRMNSSV